MKDRLRLEPYLELAMEKGASDIYFTTHAPVMMRIEGELHPLRAADAATLTPTVLEQLVHDTLDEQQRKIFEAEHEYDFAFRYGLRGRFRGNAFRQRGSAAMVLRNIGGVPNFEEFGMPQVLSRLAMEKRGLVLVVGATGAGKSTTLAAMVNHRNENAADHILTIEDPVEFMFRHKRSIVNQREIGTDTLSFSRAIRSALREAPDVVQIGEVRDHATADACIQLANTGHLSMATMHAANTHQCLQRLVSLFPETARVSMYMDLSLNLRGIVCQRLMNAANGKRIAAFEILLNTPHIADLILNGRLEAVAEALADADGANGAISFDNALMAMVKDNRITPEEAIANADSPDNLHSRMAFDRRSVE